MSSLSTIAQGSERPSLVVQWTHADNSTGEDLTDAVLTGYIKNLATGDVVEIQGALAVTDATAGVFTWTPDPLDVAEDGAYQVQFSATWPGEPTPGLTAVFDWEIAESIIPTDAPTALPDYQGVVKLLARTTDPDNPPEGYYGLYVKSGAFYLRDEDGNTTAFDDGSAAAAAAIAAHVAEVDPHPDYLLESDAASTYATTGHNHDAAYISVVGTPTVGNFPTLTAGGELANSTYAPASFAEAGHTHSYASALDDLTDVDAAAPNDGDVLTWSDGDSAWVAAPVTATGDMLKADYDSNADNTVDAADYATTAGDADTVDGSHAADFAASDHNHDTAYISVITTPTAGNLPTITAGGELDNSAYSPSSFAASGHGHDHGALTGLSDDDHTQYLLETQYADIYRQGFTNLTETSISFDGTNLFTLTSVGATWTYYRAGVKYTVTGNKTVTLTGTPVTAGHWHIYIDAADGTLTASLTGWTLLDAKVPVATISFNDALTPKYWMADERHTVLLDQRLQYIIHATEGAKLITSPTLTGYTLSTDSNTAKTFAISACALLDQDMRFDVAQLADPNGTATDYVVWYRTSSTAWAWAASAMPFPYSGTYIQYDSSGTLTTGQNNKFYNSYLLVTNLTGAARYVIVPGRAEFSTLATAQTEDVSAWTWGDFEIDEAVIAYRLTWQTSTSHSSNGKCVLAAAPQKVNVATVTNASSGAGTDHNTLSNLQGGTVSEYYHLTSTEYTDLTDGGATTLHKHDHGGMDGLADDDHTQYLLASDATNRSTFASNWTDLTDAGDTTLHTHTVDWTDVQNKPSIYQSTLFLHNTASGVSTYKTALTSPSAAAETTLTAIASNISGEVLIAAFSTPQMGVSVINGNAWSFKTFAKVDSTNGVSTIKVRVYKRDTGGTETELFNDTSAEINATVATEYDIDSVQTSFTCNITDRLVVKYYAQTTSSSNRTFTLYLQGSSNASHVSTPLVFASLTVSSDTIWAAKGDIAVATGADAAQALTVGANGTVLTADDGETTGVKWAAPTTPIAASLIDAKGDLVVGSADNTPAKLTVGTNTHVLTANSGATNGVEWAAIPSQGGIPLTTVDAKGDLIVGSAADTVARLAVGATDGHVLTVDAAEATGLKWAAAAGGGAVATDTIFDTKGDLPVGTGANTAEKLTAGANGTVLMAASGETTGLKWQAPTRYITLGRYGTLTATAGSDRLYVPYACTIVNVYASVSTAPTGADLICDVHANGATIFSTQGNRPTIAASAYTDTSSTPDTTAISANDYLTLDCDQVGSTIAGADLRVVLEVTTP